VSVSDEVQIETLPCIARVKKKEFVVRGISVFAADGITLVGRVMEEHPDGVMDVYFHGHHPPEQKVITVVGESDGWAVHVEMDLFVEADSAAHALLLAKNGVSLSTRILGGRWKPEMSFGVRKATDDDL